MSTVLSKNGTKGFARFLVAYLCLALAAPATPLLAAPGDIIDNSGLIPLSQAFFAFEVEGPLGGLKDEATWDEIEKVLDNPYLFELDNVDFAIYPNGPWGTTADNITGRQAVDNTTGIFLGAGTGNNDGWPSYRRTDDRRRAVYYRSTVDNTPCQPEPGNPASTCQEVVRSFIYRNAAGETCAPGSAGCNEVPLSKFLIHPLNYNYQGGEELRLVNPQFEETEFDVPGDLMQSFIGDPPVPEQMICGTLPDGVTPDGILRDVYRYTPKTITVSAGSERIEDDEASIDFNSPIRSDFVKYGAETCIRTLEFIFSPGPGPGMGAEFGIVQERIAEGVCLCGGDPGEPGYPNEPGNFFGGFGVIGELGFGTEGTLATMYSTPTVPGRSTPGSLDTENPYATRVVEDVLIGGGSEGHRLFDPARGFIYARDPVTGFGMDNNGVVDPEPFDADGVYPNIEARFPFGFATLHKPSLRIPLEGCLADDTSHLRCGSGIAPNYLWNSEDALRDRAFDEFLEEELGEMGVDEDTATPEQLAEATAEATEEAEEKWQASLAPSNENDYIRNREAATILGKAIFWDQQLGSDSVQSCGTCHFHAGADNRTKNQLNPNHLSGDFTFQLKGPNQEIEAADFPFHKLADIEIAGDPACILPVVTPFGQVVCDASNVVSDANEVMSSMGVFFGNFGDIPPIGTFTPAVNGVASVPPDIRSATPLNFRQQLEAAVTLGRTDVADLNVGNVDPIPGFQGLRRVEPRNTPTLFLSAMNFDNFWDGRARHDFNGGSVFGPADPQSHVWVFDNNAGTLVPTRQIIRFTSLASLFTGPALSDFEMSHRGRNWAKIGKKLLQAGVTPLANQLVDTTDSVLGIYSNQGGAACASLAANSPADLSGNGATAVGKPGLCISYNALIRNAYYPALWENQTQHLNGATSGCTKPLKHGERDPSDPPNCDPFDGYVLALGSGEANLADTNQFTQMEANVPLLFGLAVQAWGNILVADDAPMDRFFDANPDSFKTFGEAAENFLVVDFVGCADTGGVQSCFTEVGNFKRDSQAINPNLHARVNCSNETCTNPGAASIPTFGTRLATDPDPLLGLDFFLGSNMSLKNPGFKSARCGECHAGGNLTDHTFGTSHQTSFIDWVHEFITPGHELFPEPLTRGRMAHPFALEGELGENAQDGIERNVADFELDEFGFPKGMALFDNGMYNLGIRPIHEDQGRGGPDPFGWPLSLGYLALKNLAGQDYSPGGDDPETGFAQPAYPGIPLSNWEPQAWVLDNTGLVVLFDNTNLQLSNCGLAPGDLAIGDPIPNCNVQTGLQGDPTGGGLLAPTGQDFQINPGFAEEPADPLLPPYLAPWASNINVGDETQIDEVFVGLNTLLREPHIEGFVDTWGPFNPAATVSEVNNNARQVEMGTWPNVNRINTQGAFKAAPLRHVDLTGPYFHTGSKLTLRQQLDFYDRGGDFPFSNSPHRDFLIMHLDIEDEALGGYINPATGLPIPRGTPGAVPEFTEEQKEAIKIALIDFLMELTDERVRFERAPFDHPEVIVPLDGRAPENHGGRAAMLAQTTGDCGGVAGAGPCFRAVPAVGELGNLDPLPRFLGITGERCSPKPGGIQFGPGGGTAGDAPPFPGSAGSFIVPDCSTLPQLSQYDSDTTRLAAAAAGAIGSTSAGATVAATSAAQVSALKMGSAAVVPKASSVLGVTLSADPGSPQAGGATVTFTAEAFGGSGDYEYEYWATADYYNDGAPFIARSYSTIPSWKWAASPGNFTFFVKARKVGSAADAEATSTEVPFVVE
jgi:hypothetical protein